MIVIFCNLSIGKITPKHFRFQIPQRRKIDLMTQKNFIWAGKYHKQHCKTDNGAGGGIVTFMSELVFLKYKSS